MAETDARADQKLFYFFVWPYEGYEDLDEFFAASYDEDDDYQEKQLEDAIKAFLK